MQLDGDIVYVVVEFLAKAKGFVSQPAVLDEVPFERRSVTGALYGLYACGFVERAPVKPGSSPGVDGEYLFCITKAITAYQIIKLGEMGIDMNSLSGLVKISDKQKQAAMALTMQTEKLQQLDEESRTRRAESAAKTTKAKPLPRDSIVDTLERLALASEMSIKEMGGAKGSEDVMRALVDAKEQALKALAQYQSQLQAGGADPVDF